jgi:AhpD family alkylhydroperoxidase
LQARLDAHKAAPELVPPLRALDAAIHGSGLEPSLIELVKIRASQINGYAYCRHMHTGDARKRGESEARLYLLDAWQESALYTPREKAALAWTESLTLIAETRAPDEVFAGVREQFSDEELARLTAAIGMINLWNRIAIGLRYVHPRDTRPEAA